MPAGSQASLTAGDAAKSRRMKSAKSQAKAQPPPVVITTTLSPTEEEEDAAAANNNKNLEKASSRPTTGTVESRWKASPSPADSNESTNRNASTQPTTQQSRARQANKSGHAGGAGGAAGGKTQQAKGPIANRQIHGIFTALSDTLATNWRPGVKTLQQRRAEQLQANKPANKPTDQPTQ